MKKVTVIILSLIFLAGLDFKTEAADLGKIGYVDILKVFNEYQKTKVLEEELDNKRKTKKAEREKIVAEIKRIQDELEISSDKEKEKKQEEIEGKMEQLQDFDRVTRVVLTKESDAKSREIREDIKRVIQEYGQKEGYILILNSNEITLSYATEEIDLTDKIIGILNERYKKK